jgi:hypothetical protein
MSEDISQEAQTALARVSRQKALQRLHRDGSDSTRAMQRRVRALAAERSMPPADIHKLMYKRVRTNDLIAFCKKHKVAADWLLCGDLKGLQRMTQEAKAATGIPIAPKLARGGPTAGQLKEKYAWLTPAQRRIVEEEVDRLLEKRRSEAPDEPA